MTFARGFPLPPTHLDKPQHVTHSLDGEVDGMGSSSEKMRGLSQVALVIAGLFTLNTFKSRIEII